MSGLQPQRNQRLDQGHSAVHVGRHDCGPHFFHIALSLNSDSCSYESAPFDGVRW